MSNPTNSTRGQEYIYITGGDGAGTTVVLLSVFLGGVTLLLALIIACLCILHFRLRRKLHLLAAADLAGQPGSKHSGQQQQQQPATKAIEAHKYEEIHLGSSLAGSDAESLPGSTPAANGTLAHYEDVLLKPSPSPLIPYTRNSMMSKASDEKSDVALQLLIEAAFEASGGLPTSPTRNCVTLPAVTSPKLPPSPLIGRSFQFQSFQLPGLVSSATSPDGRQSEQQQQQQAASIPRPPWTPVQRSPPPPVSSALLTPESMNNEYLLSVDSQANGGHYDVPGDDDDNTAPVSGVDLDVTVNGAGDETKIDLLNDTYVAVPGTGYDSDTQVYRAMLGNVPGPSTPTSLPVSVSGGPSITALLGTPAMSRAHIPNRAPMPAPVDATASTAGGGSSSVTSLLTLHAKDSGEELGVERSTQTAGTYQQSSQSPAATRGQISGVYPCVQSQPQTVDKYLYYEAPVDLPPSPGDIDPQTKTSLHGRERSSVDLSAGIYCAPLDSPVPTDSEHGNGREQRGKSGELSPRQRDDVAATSLRGSASQLDRCYGNNVVAGDATGLVPPQSPRGMASESVCKATGDNDDGEVVYMATDGDDGEDTVLANLMTLPVDTHPSASVAWQSTTSGSAAPADDIYMAIDDQEEAPMQQHNRLPGDVMSRLSLQSTLTQAAAWSRHATLDKGSTVLAIDETAEFYMAMAEDAPGQTDLAKKDDAPGQIYMAMDDDAPGQVYMAMADDAPGQVYMAMDNDAPGQVYMAMADDAPGQVYMAMNDDAPGQVYMAMNNDAPGQVYMAMGDDGAPQTHMATAETPASVTGDASRASRCRSAASLASHQNFVPRGLSPQNSRAPRAEITADTLYMAMEDPDMPTPRTDTPPPLPRDRQGVSLKSSRQNSQSTKPVPPERGLHNLPPATEETELMHMADAPRGQTYMDVTDLSTPFTRSLGKGDTPSDSLKRTSRLNSKSNSGHLSSKSTLDKASSSPRVIPAARGQAYMEVTELLTPFTKDLKQGQWSGRASPQRGASVETENDTYLAMDDSAVLVANMAAEQEIPASLPPPPTAVRPDVVRESAGSSSRSSRHGKRASSRRHRSSKRNASPSVRRDGDDDDDDGSDALSSPPQVAARMHDTVTPLDGAAGWPVTASGTPPPPVVSRPLSTTKRPDGQRFASGQSSSCVRDNDDDESDSEDDNDDNSGDRHHLSQSGHAARMGFLGQASNGSSKSNVEVWTAVSIPEEIESDYDWPRQYADDEVNDEVSLIATYESGDEYVENARARQRVALAGQPGRPTSLIPTYESDDEYRDNLFARRKLRDSVRKQLQQSSMAVMQQAQSKDIRKPVPLPR